jgi:hypothetical protein
MAQNGRWSLSAEISSYRGLHRVGRDKESCVPHPTDSSKYPGANAGISRRIGPGRYERTFAPQQAMSALPPKADMCSALAHVRSYPESRHVRCN